jgi:serine/threonine-protein kinase
MSPEHIKGDRQLDIRTDVYGLGATVFHALTGVKPFEGSTPFEIMRKKLDSTVPEARSARKDVSEPMSLLLQSMMAKDRKDRHETPTELVADIRLVLQGQVPNRKPVATARKTVDGAVSRAPEPAKAAPSKAPAFAPAPEKRTSLLTPPRRKSSFVTILFVLVVLGLAGALAYLALQKKGIKLFGSQKEQKWVSSTG